jgi:hypothetical protein
MRIITIVLAMLVATGCSSLIPYQQNESLGANEAGAEVERALMSQSKRFVSEYVEISDDFIEYGEGVVTEGRRGGIAIPVGGGVAIGSGKNRSRSKAITQRIYFDTFNKAELYSRNSWFVVKVYSNDRQPPKHFYLYDEVRGQRLIDGIYSLKKQWAAAKTGKSNASAD